MPGRRSRSCGRARYGGSGCSRPLRSTAPTPAPTPLRDGSRISSRTAAKSTPAAPSTRKISCHGRTMPSTGSSTSPWCRGELDHQPAEQERQTRADVDAHRVNAHRGTAQLRREAVGDQRVGRGRERRLADPDADAEHEKVQKVLAVPHSAVIRLQTSTPMAMMPRRLCGRPGARWARRRWCRTLRRKAHEQAHVGVGDIQIAADRLHQQVENLPVDEGQHVGEHQDRDRHPGAGARG